MNSVVHTGVKSAGCEKRITHLPGAKVESWISPCVLLALKSGAGPLSSTRGRTCSMSDMLPSLVEWVSERANLVHAAHAVHRAGRDGRGDGFDAMIECFRATDGPPSLQA